MGTLPSSRRGKRVTLFGGGPAAPISNEPKSVKRLRSGDLLIETSSALQTKSLLLATSFLDSLLTIIPHKSLNTSRGVISESDLLSSPEVAILEGFSDQELLKLLSSVPQPNASPSIPSVSTSSYTTQANILPFATSIKPTTQIESRLPGPISTSAAAPDNSLNTSTSSLSTETCPAPTTSNKFAALQPSEPLLEFATTSNSELSIHLKKKKNICTQKKSSYNHETRQECSLTYGRHLGRSDMVVARCWQQWITEGRVYRRGGSGRPRNTNDREDRAIRRVATSAPTTSLASIQRHLPPSRHPVPSRETIRDD
ncbi:uncharacterized protein TNCV_3869621 [Trichonephila clavipes]|nr:uncharacterized protein TNCV_3869621 [Trichonephila clavipes]